MKVQELREIIRLVDQSSIKQFTYKNADSTLRINKVLDLPNDHQYSEVMPVQTSTQIAESSALEKQKAVVAPEAPEQQSSLSSLTGEVENNTTEISSPMVGTFYRKPSPDSDNYVEVGQQVDEGTVVCILEAMKLFNEIEAEVKGEITEILVNDGELVEFGQPLFKVKTT